MTDPSPAHRRPTRRERREKALADALRGLLQDLVSEGMPEQPAKGPPLALTLRMDWQPGQGGELSFHPPLCEQVEHQLREQDVLWNLFVEGAVFDARAGTSTGPDCRPPSPRHVFAGYDAQGTPGWEVLPTMRDAGPPVFEIRKGKELRAAKTPVREDLVLHGQVALGFLPLPAAYARIAGDKVLALTVQIVESHGARGAFRLEANVLAGGLLPQELKDLLQEPALRAYREAIQALSDELAVRERIAAESRARQDMPTFREAMSGLTACLDALRERLSAQGGKPAGFDAADWGHIGRSSRVYFDTRRESWVVLAEGDRAYVLDLQGEAITSFEASPAMVRERVASGRWRLATDTEREALRGHSPSA
jgi:hypothetical protein